MKMLKSLVIGSVLLVGSTQIYAADGSERSIKMNEKFRADQKRIHGTESAKRKIDELQIKDTRQDQNNTESKKQTKAD